MRLRSVSALIAVLGVAACIDFVEPTSLGLAEPTRLLVTIHVSAQGCGGPPPAAGQAAVCVDASLHPGVDRFGRYRQIRNDTLYVSGRRLEPSFPGADSVRHYRMGWSVDAALLADSALAVVYPVVEGVTLPAPGFRWHAAGQADPDTVSLAANGDLLLHVSPPAAAPMPAPRTQTWSVDVWGSAAQLTVRGTGFPWPSFRIPASLLADLRGDPLGASLKYTQITYPEPSDQLILYVQMIQTLDWAVRDPPN